MSQAVFQWIKDRLGIVIDYDPEKFADKVRDGILLANILESYCIITKEEKALLKPSVSPEDCELNFTHYLNPWLQQININIPQVMLTDIVYGKSQAALYLFYKVYLELCDLEILNIISEKKANISQSNANSKFDVKVVRESLLDSYIEPTNDLAKPISQNYDIIHWHRDRLQLLLQKCEDIRDEYLYFLKRNNAQISTFYLPLSTFLTEIDTEDDVKSLNEPYEDLKRQQNEAKRLSTVKPDPKKAKQLMNKMRLRKMEAEARNIFKKQLQAENTSYFWSKLQEKAEHEFNEMVSEKLLKQSYYEKQMMKTLIDVKAQKDYMLFNKRVLDKNSLQAAENALIDEAKAINKNINAKNMSYYFEKDRICQLHKRLYSEKLKLQMERNYNICVETMEDMVNIALKEAEFKEAYGEEPDRRVKEQWKALFLSNQPIFERLDPLELMKTLQKEKGISCKKPNKSHYYGENDSSSGSLFNSDEYSLLSARSSVETFEEIFQAELERQKNLDEQDFQAYLDLKWPWEISEETSDMERSDVIISHVIHKLLCIKYPPPSLPEKPDLSHIKIATCINELYDEGCINKLKLLLRFRKVKVIDMSEIINFCIQCYKEEVLQHEAEILERINADSDSCETDSTNKSESLSAVPEEDITDAVNKCSQTPAKFPADVVLSRAADLGKLAEGDLNLGKCISDNTLAAMFVEYLKRDTDISGFALLNYPSNLQQAAALEEALTGKAVPIPEGLKDVTKLSDLADIEERFSAPLDNDKEKRQSKILFTFSKKLEEPFNSFLTAYIKLIQVEAEESEISQHDFKCLETMDSLENFYCEAGCNYSLYYKEFNYNTIKKLGKLIIGDYSLPPKDSADIFGQSLYYLDDGTDSIDSYEKLPAKKSKVDKESAKESTKASTKETSKEVLASFHESVCMSDKAIQVPDDEEIVSIPEGITQRLSVVPGHPEWIYLDFPIPEEIAIGLASIWESIEKIYIDNFKQLFFMKRLLTDSLMPYSSFMRNHIRAFVARPDHKQGLLSKFQKIYNMFDDDFRTDDEFKAEVHCRILELKERLYEITDQRMMECEEERIKSIEKPWYPRQICEILNIYITMIQLEIDRCIDSVQLLNDYYSTMLTKIPCGYIYMKENMERISCIGDDYLNPAISESLINALKDPSEKNKTTFFHKKIGLTYDHGVEILDKLSRDMLQPLEIMNSTFSKFTDSGKTSNKDKKKKESKTLPVKINILDVDPEIIKRFPDLISEWSVALRGEIVRGNFRLKILYNNCLEQFDEFVTIGKKTAKEFYDFIVDEYHKEIDSIDKACGVLARAVEEESAIQPELLLSGASFHVHAEKILYPEEVEIPKRFAEYNQTEAFDVDQLEFIRKQFMRIAANGYLAERSFCYILEDLITYNREDEREPLVPVLWQKIDLEKINKLLLKLFDELEYIQWKDFIIMNLLVPYPTEEDITQLMSQLKELDPDKTELIYDYQFYSAKLWFETNIPNSKKVKKLLFNLYNVNESQINYTAMLIDFCKDENPIAGFAKALQVCFGKPVCWNKTKGEEFVKKIMEKRNEGLTKHMNKIKDIEACRKDVKHLLTDIVDEVVIKCDGVIIEDYSSTSSNPGFSEEAQDGSNSSKKLSLEYSFSSIRRDEEGLYDSGMKDSISTDREYFLSLDVLIVVISCCIPWHSRVYDVADKSFKNQVEDIFENCRNPQFNNQVLAHEFLNCVEFVELLKKTSRFTAKNPIEIVKAILQEE